MSEQHENWNFHAERDQLIAEAHARPSQGFTPPGEILHVAFRTTEETNAEFAGVIAGDAEIPDNARHITGKRDGVCIKFERHNEFTSCTLLRDATSKQQKASLQSLFEKLFPVAQVEILVLLHLDIHDNARTMLKAVSTGDRFYGGQIRGEIDVRSTFIPDDTGAIRFILNAPNQTRDELGRRIQRVIEMETYRTMSLLGLTMARTLSGQLAEYERELDELNTSLREGITNPHAAGEEMYERFTALSEKNNLLASEFRYRFAASRAYYDLFRQRVVSLEEKTAGDMQTMSGFLHSRLDPAMATIESTAKRQETLTNDLSRALLLLRTRIELNLNKGNQELLKSMDRRHDQQLKISRTVEGLSVIAITYYSVGLASYLLKALAKQPWMPFSATMLTALSVPFILGLVWFFLHRIRKAWEERGEP